ncbi:MAG: hypothetical protein ACOC5G_04040 [Acidobacteriota bacterium]
MSPIKNVSDVYRPVRVGKIHLGIKVQSNKKCKCVRNNKAQKDCPLCEGGGKLLIPKEVDYFVLREAPELKEYYPEKPKKLKIALPSIRFERSLEAYMEKIFPQYLKRYVRSGLICKGNGETADTIAEDGSLKTIECPCEYLDTGECKRVGIFRFRDRHTATLNVYQITTSSYNSIVNINSFVRDLIEHCAVHGVDPSNVKLILKREKQPIQRRDGAKISKSTHYIMQLDFDRDYYKSIEEVVEDAKKVPTGEKQKIPPPDESRDPLFFPDPEVIQEVKMLDESKEEEPEEEARETEEIDPVEDMKNKVSEVMVKCKIKGEEITDAVLEKVAKMETIEELEKPLNYYKERLSELENNG